MHIAIIADDVTGTLDAAAPFIEAGVDVVVHAHDHLNLTSDHAVVAINAQTRHETSADAAKRVRYLVRRACQAGARIVIKKTDSVLRGNVGAELQGMLDANVAERVVFAPAFPEMERVTQDGIHFVQGEPLSTTSFGNDPFDPVATSRVRDMLREQTQAQLLECAVGQKLPVCDTPHIVICDALTQQDLECRVAEVLAETSEGELMLLAGCAGISKALAQVVALPAARAVSGYGVDGVLRSGLLVVCGSVNQISQEQVRFAKKSGAQIMAVPRVAKLDPSWPRSSDGQKFVAKVVQAWDSQELTVLDSSHLFSADVRQRIALSDEQLRVLVARSLGSLAAELLRRRPSALSCVMGGDILSETLDALGLCKLEPVAELTRGVVLSRARLGAGAMHLISKSGGFGSEKLFVELAARYIRKDKAC